MPYKWQRQTGVPAVAFEVISDWFKDIACALLFSPEATEEDLEELVRFEKELAIRVGDAAEMAKIAQWLRRRELRFLFCFQGDDELFHEKVVFD